MIRSLDDNLQVERNGIFIPCVMRLVVIVLGGVASLQNIIARADGVIEIAGEQHDLQDLEAMVSNGRVRTHIQPGEFVFVYDVCTIVAGDTIEATAEADFVKDVVDAIAKLNKLPTSLDRCISAYETYMSNPDDSNREALRKAYMAMPRHRGLDLSGFDRMDIRIGEIVGESLL